MRKPLALIALTFSLQAFAETARSDKPSAQVIRNEKQEVTGTLVIFKGAAAELLMRELVLKEERRTYMAKSPANSVLAISKTGQLVRCATIIGGNKQDSSVPAEFTECVVATDNNGNLMAPPSEGQGAQEFSEAARVIVTANNAGIEISLVGVAKKPVVRAAISRDGN